MRILNYRISRNTEKIYFDKDLDTTMFTLLKRKMFFQGKELGKRYASCFFIALLTVFLTSCRNYHKMVQQEIFEASATDLRFSGVCGIATPPGCPEQRNLILEYSLGEEHVWGPDYSRIFIAIPLDDKMRVMEPLNLMEVGGDKQPDGFIRSVFSKKMSEIKTFSFQPSLIKNGMELIKTGQVVPINNNKGNWFGFSCAATVNAAEIFGLYGFSENEYTPFSFVLLWPKKQVRNPENCILKKGEIGFVGSYVQKPASYARDYFFGPPESVYAFPTVIPRADSDIKNATRLAIVKFPVDVCGNIVAVIGIVAWFPVYTLLSLAVGHV